MKTVSKTARGGARAGAGLWARASAQMRRLDEEPGRTGHAHPWGWLGETTMEREHKR